MGAGFPVGSITGGSPAAAGGAAGTDMASQMSRLAAQRNIAGLAGSPGFQRFMGTAGQPGGGGYQQMGSTMGGMVGGLEAPGQMQRSPWQSLGGGATPGAGPGAGNMEQAIQQLQGRQPMRPGMMGPDTGFQRPMRPGGAAGVAAQMGGAAGPAAGPGGPALNRRMRMGMGAGGGGFRPMARMGGRGVLR